MPPESKSSVLETSLFLRSWGKTATTTQTTVEPDFLRERLAGAHRVTTLIVGSFLVCRLAFTEFVLDGSFIYHGLATLILALSWWLITTWLRSIRALRIIEALTMTAVALCLALMGQTIDLYNRPELMVVLALALCFQARAAYVPSSAMRTLLLGLMAGLPVAWGSYGYYVDMDIALWSQIEPVLTQMTGHEIASLRAAWAVAWWCSVVGISTATSAVVYGLRREVQRSRVLGQYRLGEKLGEGGMGEVYRGQHALLQRPVAIKLLRPERVSAPQLTRFEKEVQHSARLEHPHTIRVFDHGRSPDGTLYYVMELLDGADLQRLVDRDGPMPAEQVIKVLVALCAALHEAHSIGLVHRDIKPANVMLCRHGGMQDFVKLLDFGLVKDLSGEADPRLTAVSTFTGTPLFMAPEAIRHPDRIDARSDLYALGALGYFLLTATPVFSGRLAVEVCGHHLHSKPEPPSARLGHSLPPRLEATILSCLEKAPEARPQTAPELSRRLTAETSAD